MVECSLRCSCNSAPIGCSTHIDPGPTPTPERAFTVSVCFSEFPPDPCSRLESEYGHPLTLEGPIPYGSARDADEHTDDGYHFLGVTPGTYIVRTEGCNPFGCWLDTPLTVVDQDVRIKVQQIGPPPTGAPRATPTSVVPCQGDWDGNQRVTIDELVGAVANALAGCPP